MMLEVWPNWCGLVGIEKSGQERGKSEDPLDTRREIPARVHAPRHRESGPEFDQRIRLAVPGQQFRNQVGELLGDKHPLVGVIAPLLSIHEQV